MTYHEDREFKIQKHNSTWRKLMYVPSYFLENLFSIQFQSIWLSRDLKHTTPGERHQDLLCFWGILNYICSQYHSYCIIHGFYFKILTDHWYAQLTSQRCSLKYKTERNFADFFSTCNCNICNNAEVPNAYKSKHWIIRAFQCWAVLPFLWYLILQFKTSM